MRTFLLALLPLALAGAEKPDVIIIGAGIAGLTTALEAARGGANVVVVDVASVFGGHAIVSEGGLALAGTPLQLRLGVKDSSDLLYQDIIRVGVDANAGWARMYADRSLHDIYEWMTELGVNFNALQHPPGNSAARFHVNPRRGYGLVEPIYRERLKTGRTRFYWNTRITSVNREGRRVTSVDGVNERTGKSFHLSAKAIVIATGGFQSNLPYVQKNWPPDLAVPPKILIGSGVNALGSGLELARDAGAAISRLDHQWNYPRGIPDPRYPGGNRGLHVLAHAVIWVNANGERFANESDTFDVLLKQMLAQPGGQTWLVFDDEGRKSLRISGTDWTDPARVQSLILQNPALTHTADRLEALARKAGWPTANFLGTIARYNEDLQHGTDTQFNRFNPTLPPIARVGRPALTPLATPPFYAIPLSPMTRKSLGGIVVDLDGRALDAKESPSSAFTPREKRPDSTGSTGKRDSKAPSSDHPSSKDESSGSNSDASQPRASQLCQSSRAPQQQERLRPANLVTGYRTSSRTNTRATGTSSVSTGSSWNEQQPARLATGNVAVRRQTAPYERPQPD